MEEKKFELTDEFKVNVCGVKLFRIRALVDIEARNVKKGDLGGFVEKESNLSGDAWVSDNAEVYGNAWVSGNAEVYGNARVSDNARVYGDAEVSDNAWVSGNARVYGNACLKTKAKFTKGWFIGGDDSGKITDITEQTGSDFLASQYVLGDYEIEDIDHPAPTNTYTFNLTQEEYDRIKDIINNEGR